jgi:hypothetical protein
MTHCIYDMMDTKRRKFIYGSLIGGGAWRLVRVKPTLDWRRVGSSQVDTGFG